MGDYTPIIKRLDEAVVNRIAAGEVIQRPANAIKEMLENSLDSGATSIQIVVKQGGLKLIQIQDDGCGIRKEDLGIVCERFTTSKLSNFDDLKSISTYGFRGEALASITHISHVTIVTKTKDAQCAYKAKYSDGKLVPAMPGHSGEPRPCAGNRGTQITVEDLFYNVAIRRKALKNISEEYNKIYDIVSKYAIHNSSIGFIFKKYGENVSDIRTSVNSTSLDNIQIIYGSTVTKELLSIKHKNEKLGYELIGHISNANYSTKKCIFILFINHRLVDSSNLKKAVEAVYSNYLPKDKHPFVYLSLIINPASVDVNVHPTKHEVHFLHEDLIVSSLQTTIESELLGANESRSYYTQTLMPSLSKRKDPEKSEEKGNVDKDKTSEKVYAHQMVRTDAKSRKLEEFLLQGDAKNSNNTQKNGEPVTLSIVQQRSSHADDLTDETGGSHGNNIQTGKRKRNLNEQLLKEVAVDSHWREIRLTSIRNLRRETEENSDSSLKEILANHVFVGCVDDMFALIQHQTKLYLVNSARLTKELFYQAFLRRFGNFGFIRLSNPAPLKSLALLALNCKDSGWSQSDGSKEDLATYAQELLSERSPMLLDYFSMEIDEHDNLVSIPMIIDNYIPDLTGLPLFMLRLATEVDWSSEEDCFRSVATECSRFYSTISSKNNNLASSKMDDSVTEKESHDDENKSWKWTVEYLVFSNLKTNFLPRKELLDDGTFLEVANLPDLYKVFERC